MAFAIRHADCPSARRQAGKNEKKAPDLAQVHQAVLQHLPPAQGEVEIGRAEALAGRRGLRADRDARWSYGCSKAPPRWFWPAIEPQTGRV